MTTDAAGELRYNEVQQKSVHNTFQRSEGTADQFLYWRVRSMEVDVHHKDPLGNSIPGGDWSVHHDWYDPISTVSRLSQFLQTIRGLQRLNPKHEVITLFIDIKDPFPISPTARHGAKALDALLRHELGPSRIYTPGRFVRRARGATSLREAVEKRGWPTLRQLRGKVIVVLTGSPTQLEHYATSTEAALGRTAFVSCPVDAASHVPGNGDQIFFNINGEKNMALVGRAHQAGFVTRAYYVNSKQLWNGAAAASCHHLATDKVNESVDQWASTRNGHGFPFSKINGRLAKDAAEVGPAIGIWSRTDDLWGERDSFFFHYRRCTPSTIDATYDYAISGPNSHVEQFVKGSLMARASLDDDAAYFAVVRVGQKHGLRVQYRRRAGGPTIVMARSIGSSGYFGHDVDQDTIVHVRLRLSNGGTTATAWGSYDRSRWTKLGSVDFTGHTGDKPLLFHGLGVSSHDQPGGAKFLFVPGRNALKQPFTTDKLISRGKKHRGWSDDAGRDRWQVSP